MKYLYVTMILIMVLEPGNLAEDRRYWEDPNDVSIDHGSMKKECPTCAPPVESSCEQAALPLLKKYILTLLNHLHGQMPMDMTDQYSAHITLSANDVKVFEKFVNVENKHHVHDVHEILSRMISRVTSSRLDKREQWAQLIEHMIDLFWDRLIQFVTLAVMATIVLLIKIWLQIPWRTYVTQLLLPMFVISVLWTWYDLCKEAKTVAEDWKHMVTLLECVGLLVKVPLTKAIAVTIIRLFVTPLKDVSEFVRALLIDLPTTLYPVACLMVALFLFLFLVFKFGYSVRLSLGLLTIELNPQVTVMDNTVHRAEVDASQRTQSQLEHLQAMETFQDQILDRLQHLEQLQQLAFSVPSPPISTQSAATSNRLARNPGSQ